MVFGSQETGPALKEQSKTLGDSLRNPYFNMYHWIKGEIFDVNQIVRAIEYKEKTQKFIQ